MCTLEIMAAQDNDHIVLIDLHVFLLVVVFVVVVVVVVIVVVGVVL